MPTYIHFYDLDDLLGNLSDLHREVIGTRGDRRREILQEIKDLRLEIAGMSR